MAIKGRTVIIMLGIGYHLDKWTRQKIIAEKGRQYNGIKEELLQSGVPLSTVSKEVQKTLYDQRHKGDEQDGRLQGIRGSIDLGYATAHKTASEAADMNSKFQACRQNEQSTSRKEQREMDEKMKKRIYQDHIELMKKGIKFSDKPIASEYDQQFLYSPEMQQEVDAMELTHHQRKNDLKWYSEEYAKIKTVMRK